MSSLHFTNTQRCTENSTVDREKAWHLLAILFTIGRPACPEELVSKCRLFSVSPGYIWYLCSISNSPICLTGNGYVTVSTGAMRAFRGFTAKAIGGHVPRMGIMVLGGSGRVWDSDIKTYFRKRKGPVIDSPVLSTAKRRLALPYRNGGSDKISLQFPSRIQDTASEDHANTPNTTTGNITLMLVDFHATESEAGILNKMRAATSLFIKSDPDFSNLSMANSGHIEVDQEIGINEKDIHTPKCLDNLFHEADSNFPEVGRVVRKPNLHMNFSVCQNGNPILLEMAQMGNPESRKEMAQTDTSLPIIDVQHNASPLEAYSHLSRACEFSMAQSIVGAGTQMETSGNECSLIVSDTSSGEMGNFGRVEVAKADKALSNSVKVVNTLDMTTLNIEHTKNVRMQDTSLSVKQCSSQKQPTKSFSKLKDVYQNASPAQPRVLLESLHCNNVVNSSKQQNQCKSDQILCFMERKLKQSHDFNIHDKENMVDSISTSPKLEKKTLPHFESFIVEKEEGSGGYGIVYRAQRKNDGKMFAIKCPHDKAQKHHVNNELNMLERFGGRSFIIKFEGSFKSGNSDCFVLEHVEHDRPEGLKKEIDIFQLQWYGFCMFRALACLHKQGVVHRDVKPGNFLFSRKLNKGYLIDFNLAMDLQKYANVHGKSKSSIDHIPLPSAASTRDKKLVKRNIFRKQGGDGSGMTSTKDATSNRTPSTERLREPLPSLGRKELINLVQGAMQNPNHDMTSIPAPQRKRVPAPLGKVDSRIFCPSPMPLHSAGIAIDGKHKKEGPCVGTKGFRAPEVLFRSPHQSSKVDIWSAGVTLLYLMVGRSPFVGDPSQNIKDIAKLRGSEDLWEVAKLHNRECSFPVELLDIQYLASVELENWCRVHTKRLDFLKLIPRSLFDLVDKCLTVNPRRRITAEEALRHEFFAPCHESLKRQRMLRQFGQSQASVEA